MGKWENGNFSFPLSRRALWGFVKKYEEPTAEISATAFTKNC
jgi:hypothetical protein